MNNEVKFLADERAGKGHLALLSYSQTWRRFNRLCLESWHYDSSGQGDRMIAYELKDSGLSPTGIF